MLRPVLLLAAFFGAGALLGDDLGPADAARLLILAATLVVLALLAGARRAPAALAAASLALGASGAAAERLHYERNPLRAWVGEGAGPRLAQLVGVVSDDAWVRDGQLVFDLDVTGGRVEGRTIPLSGRARIKVGGQWPHPPLVAGDRVTVWAELREPLGFVNPGSADLQAQAQRGGLHAFGFCKSARLLQFTRGEPPGLWRQAALQTRRWARGILVNVLPAGPERAVVLAMTLGEQTALDRETAEAFRAAGTYHVLALSGAQVALLAGIAILCARRLGLRPLTQAALLTPVLVFYATLVGAQVPIVRATAMTLLVIWGRVVDLDVDLANLLGLAGGLMLVGQPSLIGDVAFQLSFAATLGLLLFTPVVLLALPPLPRMLRLSIAASLAAQLSLTLLLAASFHRLAPAALVLNLVAVPLSAAVLLSGLLVVAAGAISAPLATLAGASAWLSARLLLISGQIVQHLPALDVRVPAPGIAVAGLYLAGLLVLLRPGRRRWGLGLIAVALVMLCLPSPAGDGRLHLTALDVGQGDALVLETPSGRAFVVDAGGTATGLDTGEAVVAPYLWSRGVVRLAGVLVTHPETDHAGGVPFLLRHFAPGLLLEGPAGRGRPAYDALDTAARRQGTPRRTITRGARFELDGVRMEVLAPRRDEASTLRSPNRACVGLRVSFGAVSFLLTGDIGGADESALAEERVGVLKVPHHGSRTSSSAGLLDALGPSVAILSVGERNPFGHPDPEVLSRYAERRIAVYRTDRDGAVTLSTDGRRLWVHAFRSAPLALSEVTFRGTQVPGGL